MEEWVAEELQTVNLGDKRLNKRLHTLLEQWSARPQASIPMAGGTLADVLAAYRFCDNPKTDEQKVLAPHREATIERMRDFPVVLLVHDTTEQDYTGHEETEGLGPLNYEARIGLLQHNTYALTPERLPLGTVRVVIWGRREEEPQSPKGKRPLTKAQQRAKAAARAARKKEPIEAKESYRWVEDYHNACVIAAQVPETQIISVRDRESDIYEVYEAWQRARGGPHAQFIVRLCQDRRVQDENGMSRIREQIQGLPKKADVQITFKPTEARPTGQATIELRAGRVTLAPPYRPGAKMAPITVNVVWAHETRPPAGQDPIEWILLTSLPVDTAEQATLVVEYYTCRWEIEVFHKILKSGCFVEKLQLETDERLKVAIGIKLIVGWRTHYVMKLGRTCPDLPCTAAFDEAEWKGVWVIRHRTAPPDTPPALGEMVQWVAEFGGYLARKNDPPPGPKVMWLGLQRTKDFALAWRAFQDSQRGTATTGKQKARRGTKRYV